MFTGLTQAVGTISKNNENVKIEGSEKLLPLNIGESIAVDGVCLTVIEFTNNNFLANVSEETLEKTTLGIKARNNRYVNLEPALKLSDRIGGHLVSGHIDGQGEVCSINKLSSSWEIIIKLCNQDLNRYICQKGSICIDGISLTIANLLDDGNTFSTAVIPHTWLNTSLMFMKKGDLVNLETDLIAKYTERILMKSSSNETRKETIDKSWLINHGWI